MKSLRIWILIPLLLMAPLPSFAQDERLPGLKLHLTPEELPRLNHLLERLKERERLAPYVTLNGTEEIAAAQDFNAYFTDAARLSAANQKAAGQPFSPPSRQPTLEPGHVYRSAIFRFHALNARLGRVDLLAGPEGPTKACHCFDGRLWQISEELPPNAPNVTLASEAGVSTHLYASGLLGNLWGLVQNDARPKQSTQLSMADLIAQQLAEHRLTLSSLLTPSDPALVHADDLEVTCFIPGQNTRSAKIHLRAAIRFDSTHGFAPASFLLDHVAISPTGELAPLSTHTYTGTWQNFAEPRPGLWLPTRLELTQSTTLFIPANSEFKSDSTPRSVQKSPLGEIRTYAVNRHAYSFRDITVSETPPKSFCPDDYPPGTTVSDMDKNIGYKLTTTSSAVNPEARTIFEHNLKPIPLATTTTTTSSQAATDEDPLPSLLWIAAAISLVTLSSLIFFLLKRKSPPPSSTNP